MKTFILVSCAFFVFLSPAFATTYFDDYGYLDTIAGEYNINSGDNNVLQLLVQFIENSSYDSNLTLSTAGYRLVEYPGNSSWFQVKGTFWGIDLGEDFEESYYLVKTGKTILGGKTLIYNNLSSLRYGVIDLSEYYDADSNGISISKISHASTVSADISPVPEPTTFLLLGVGLVGLCAYRKSKI